MGLRVFVSYSGHEDQVAALRLQTLASTRPELQVYVPPVSTRSRRGVPTLADLKALNESKFVLAIISGTVPPAMQEEARGGSAACEDDRSHCLAPPRYW